MELRAHLGLRLCGEDGEGLLLIVTLLPTILSHRMLCAEVRGERAGDDQHLFTEGGIPVLSS